MLLILIGTGSAGVIANKYLLSLGLERIILRYPPAILLSYLVFIFLMRIWLSYVALVYKSSHPTVGIADKGFTQSPYRKSLFNWDGGGVDFLNSSSEYAILALLIIILILVIFGASASLIYEAPTILAEVGLQFLLAAGVIRTAQKIDRVDWMGSVLKATWKPFGLVLLIALLLGSCSELVCHDTSSIKAIVTSCRCHMECS